MVQTSASKTIHSALNPLLTLNVSVGEPSQEDYVCEVNNPLIIADSIKEIVPLFVPLHSTPFIKRKQVSLQK